MSLFAADGDWVTLKGKVVDSKNKIELIGAKIKFADSDLVVYTDPFGYFDISVPEELLQKIIIEYISYETKEFSCQQVTGELIFELPSR